MMIQVEYVNWGYNVVGDHKGRITVEATTHNPAEDAANVAFVERLMASFNACEGIPTEELAALPHGRLTQVLQIAFKLVAAASHSLPEEGEEKYLTEVRGLLAELEDTFDTPTLYAASESIQRHKH